MTTHLLPTVCAKSVVVSFSLRRKMCSRLALIPGFRAMSVAPCCCTTCLLAWTVLHALRREAGIVNIFPPSGWRMAVVLIRRSCSGCCCTDKEEKTQQHPGINTKSEQAHSAVPAIPNHYTNPHRRSINRRVHPANTTKSQPNPRGGVNPTPFYASDLTLRCAYLLPGLHISPEI